ncbi:hypothetical protein DFJ74DRAFT_774688 [Hyaloraphidium curvatum]|nr:hypothetical protein DFJ74DRAFT_774688 [Hyaloraphidium curvatum]
MGRPALTAAAAACLVLSAAWLSRPPPARPPGTDPSLLPPVHPPGAPLRPNATTAIVASFRYGHLAAHALETAIGQSRPFDFIWFVDDGAGDCGHLPALYPEVAFMMRPERLGTIANWQDVLDRVATERLIFLGADNWFRRDLHERTAAVDADVVKYDYIVVNSSPGPSAVVDHFRSIMHPVPEGMYWNISTIHSGGMLQRTAALRAAGGYMRTSRKAGQGPDAKKAEEDYDMYRALLARNATVAHVPEGLLYYRRHRTNFNTP